MSKMNSNYDDFAVKLRQNHALETLRKYILWQRKVRNTGDGVEFKKIDTYSEGPISINLDITASCNYSCPHCVDSKILNSGDTFTLDEICKSIDVLHTKGLKSIILIGGGEPVLHPQFESIVRYIKSLGLQLAIVTNGSNSTKLFNIAPYLTKNDWIRFSIDAGSDYTFQAVHRPRKSVNLMEICSSVKQIKEINNKVSIGFSYIIFWSECKVNGTMMTENVDEIPAAVELAIQNGFDYISFKPFLMKADSTFNRETLLYAETEDLADRIAQRIEQKLHKAKEISNGRIAILESINLRAMFRDDLIHFKLQPKHCHSQIFRQIVTPTGIYHCPAYRGNPEAFIATKDGYISQQNFKETITNNLELMFKFDASKECKDIVCFYNRLNWWIEDFINSVEDVSSIKAVPGEDFYL